MLKGLQSAEGLGQLTSGAEALTEKKRLIAVLKAPRHPKASCTTQKASS
jgi:hypothetical protein